MSGLLAAGVFLTLKWSYLYVSMENQIVKLYITSLKKTMVYILKIIYCFEGPVRVQFWWSCTVNHSTERLFLSWRRLQPGTSAEAPGSLLRFSARSRRCTARAPVCTESHCPAPGIWRSGRAAAPAARAWRRCRWSPTRAPRGSPCGGSRSRPTGPRTWRGRCRSGWCTPARSGP